MSTRYYLAKFDFEDDLLENESVQPYNTYSNSKYPDVLSCSIGGRTLYLDLKTGLAFVKEDTGSNLPHILPEVRGYSTPSITNKDAEDVVTALQDSELVTVEKYIEGDFTRTIAGRNKNDIDSIQEAIRDSTTDYLGEVRLQRDQSTTNCTLYGNEGKIPYILADESLYAVELLHIFSTIPFPKN